MKTKNVCYWCGINSTSRDHVPPLNLFPKNKRKELLTVPACNAHNQQLSKVDEKMRFFLQAGCKSKAAFEEFKQATARSLERPEASRFAIGLFRGFKSIQTPDGQSVEMSVCPDELQSYFEKIVRGLSFRHLGIPFGGQCYSVPMQSFVAKKSILEFYQKLAPHFHNPQLAKDGEGHNPEIFRYRYISVSTIQTQMFCVAMQFYSDIEVISSLSKTVIA